MPPPVARDCLCCHLTTHALVELQALVLPSHFQGQQSIGCHTHRLHTRQTKGPPLRTSAC